MEEPLAPCPGCGAVLPAADDNLDERFNASAACRALYHDVLYSTLALQDPAFTHQVAVDAYAAQHAGPRVKPISTTFALVGLYLVRERGFTGRQVQRVHMALAPKSKEWPRFLPPDDRTWLTVQHPAGSPDERKVDAIREWSRSVWQIWKPENERIAALLRTHLGL
jgi:hypothetical protein